MAVSVFVVTAMQTIYKYKRNLLNQTGCPAAVGLNHRIYKTEIKLHWARRVRNRLITNNQGAADVTIDRKKVTPCYQLYYQPVSH